MKAFMCRLKKYIHIYDYRLLRNKKLNMRFFKFRLKIISVSEKKSLLTLKNRFILRKKIRNIK